MDTCVVAPTVPYLETTMRDRYVHITRLPVSRTRAHARARVYFNCVRVCMNMWMGGRGGGGGGRRGGVGGCGIWE